MKSKTYTIVLELTQEEAEKLVDQMFVWDEGPIGEGWFSDTLKEVQAKVYEAADEVLPKL